NPRITSNAARIFNCLDSQYSFIILSFLIEPPDNDTLYLLRIVFTLNWLGPSLAILLELYTILIYFDDDTTASFTSSLYVIAVTTRTSGV
ncbi:MAG: hypothetical protein ACYS74_21285, partial [Planctomycetota bacterium]